MKIKGREVNNTFREIIESGNLIVNIKGKDWSIPYTYSEKYDDMFSDYDIDVDLTISDEMKKKFGEDLADDLQDEIDNSFTSIKVI
jgi:hypothetical protein